jgi:hypothetical protein
MLAPAARARRLHMAAAWSCQACRQFGAEPGSGQGGMVVVMPAKVVLAAAPGPLTARPAAASPSAREVTVIVR